jgi:cyclophilin family peptidyl-prolyl cis-trans isomerase
MKEIRLYPGTSDRNNDSVFGDVVGGIDIVYELQNGEEIEDGLIDLECKMDNA